MDRVATTELEELFEKQRQYVNYFFETLDYVQAEKAFQACCNCKGLLVLMGVGKSGIIAEKIALTLVSTGTRALFLPAINFLHGDIGAISKEDLIVMLSKSGESQELLDLIPHVHRKGSKILGLVSDGESRLAKKADFAVELPVEKELCPFDLAPTTSTAVQLLFGDVLSMALMRKKGFSLEEYAGNHPSGTIGKKISFCVRDLMKRGGEVPFCRPEDPLVNVIVKLSNKKCGCLLVLSKEGKLLGIFTDGDLRRRLQAEGGKIMEKTMEELMTLSPITVEPQELAIEAMKKMQSKRYVMVAPVVEEEKVVGLIRMHDIIHEGIE